MTARWKIRLSYGAKKEVGEVRLENCIIHRDAFSPLLFVLMIDPLIKIMNKNRWIHVEILSYWSSQNTRPFVSENTTPRIKIYDTAFQFSKSTSPVVSLTHNAFKEARGDITTGVTRRFLRGVEGEPAGNDTTWAATQVGLRTVEAGLGGHDDGV